MTVYIIFNNEKKEAALVAKKVAIQLKQCGVNTVTDMMFNNKPISDCIKQVTSEQALTQCDFIITLGGDGTILRAARKSLPYKKPIVGINVGHLGFLATIEQNELHLLNNIVTGNYKIDKRSILNIVSEKKEQTPQIALNEVVIGKQFISQTIDIKIYCDETLVNEFRGDGVIIATPTGSTAYSLSAGGPVLDASINGIVVTPLCAHSMNSPPMVFSAQRKIRVKASSNMHSQIVYSCDGQQEIPLDEKGELNVTLSNEFMSLISLRDAEQFKAIDKKLKGR